MIASHISCKCFVRHVSAVWRSITTAHSCIATYQLAFLRHVASANLVPAEAE